MALERVIAITNQKGGVGKSTLAINIAHMLRFLAHHVLIVDADTQQSVINWTQRREHDLPACLSVMSLVSNRLHRDLGSHIQNYDYTIIDCPGRSDEITRSAIAAADFVLVPVTPSPYDIWASKEILKLIREAESHKQEDVKYSFMLNRVIPNTLISRDAAEVLEENNIPLLKNHVCQRVVFAEALTTGLTVFETQPDSKAAEEINNLTIELEELTWPK